MTKKKKSKWQMFKGKVVLYSPDKRHNFYFEGKHTSFPFCVSSASSWQVLGVKSVCTGDHASNLQQPLTGEENQEYPFSAFIWPGLYDSGVMLSSWRLRHDQNYCCHLQRTCYLIPFKRHGPNLPPPAVSCCLQ